MIPITYPIAHVPLLGKGFVTFDRFDVNGLRTGYQPFGNVTKCGLDIKDDIAELYGSVNAASSLIASALKKRQPKISLTGTDFSANTMAMALMGALSGASALAIAATVVTAEVLASVTATKHGRYFRTLSKNIDPLPANIVVHSGVGGVTTLVAGTDYQLVDPVQGIFYFPLGSAVLETAQVTVDYHTLIATFSQVAGGVAPRAKGALHFSPDPTDGARIELDVWNVNFSPTGTVELISDDYGNWQLDGLILDDSVNHPQSPFFLLTYL